MKTTYKHAVKNSYDPGPNPRPRKPAKKECPRCGKMKPLTEYYKYESAGNTHTYWCKKCVEWYIKNVSVGAN